MTSLQKHEIDYELYQVNDKKESRIFALSVTIMLVTGSLNDIFGKLVYQLLPNDDESYNDMSVQYWGAWFLTFGSFFICSFAIINGRESFKLLSCINFIRIAIPGIFDLIVDSLRYLRSVNNNR